MIGQCKIQRVTQQMGIPLMTRWVCSHQNRCRCRRLCDVPSACRGSRSGDQEQPRHDFPEETNSAVLSGRILSVPVVFPLSWEIQAQTQARLLQLPGQSRLFMNEVQEGRRGLELHQQLGNAFHSRPAMQPRLYFKGYRSFLAIHVRPFPPCATVGKSEH